MSAYVVSPDTIDLIVSAAYRYNTTFQPSLATEPHGHSWSVRTYADKFAELLWAENVRSVNFLYGDERTTIGQPYDFNRVNLDAIALGDNIDALTLASIRCLRYQSCECPDYEQTDAAKLLDAIERDAIRSVTSAVYAPWGWTREQAKIRKELRQAEVKNFRVHSVQQ